jgi:hypothetical protein
MTLHPAPLKKPNEYLEGAGFIGSVLKYTTQRVIDCLAFCA